MKKFLIAGLCIGSLLLTACGNDSGIKIGTYTCDVIYDAAPKLYIFDDENFSISYVDDPEEAEYTGIYEIQEDKLLLYDITDYNPVDGTKEDPTLLFNIEDNETLVYAGITETSFENVIPGTEFNLSEE